MAYSGNSVLYISGADILLPVCSGKCSNLNYALFSDQKTATSLKKVVYLPNECGTSLLLCGHNMWRK